MTLAVHFQTDKIQVSRGGPSETELVMFEDTNCLPTEFMMTADAVRPVIATTDSDTDQIVKLHVEAEGMEIRLTGTNAEKIPVDGVLHTVFKAIREADESESDEIVIVGAENQVIERAAIAAGFSGAAFISPVEAAIRWAGAETDGARAVLFCHRDGSIAWEFTTFTDEGDLIENGGGVYIPADPTRMDHGFGKFLVALKDQEIAQIIVAGSAEPETIEPFLSALESHYRYKILTDANAVVLGAALPPLKSKYGKFDERIAAAVNAVSNAEFSIAMAAFENATSLFESPPEPIQRTSDQFRHQLRKAILAALREKNVIFAAAPLFEMALALSETDQEKAAVYKQRLHLCGQAGKIPEAEAAAITAAFYDPENESSYMEALRHYQEDADQEDDETLHSDSGSQQAAVWLGLGLLSVFEGYFFLRTFLP